MTTLIDMTGQRIGRWTVELCLHGKWRCRCDCGNFRMIVGSALRNRRTLSCGCRMQEINTRHGHARKHGKRTKTYQSWYSMIQRCKNSRHKQFHDYGGRGINVCDDWLDFKKFLCDMGEKPTGMSLDRIENDVGYSKNNCRWATRSEQQTNQRRTHYLTIKGVTKPLAIWAKDAGLYPALVRNRIFQCGWPPEKALTTPAR